MAETNVAAVWNAVGCLEFRQGEPGNASGPLLARINSSGNGMDIQIARTGTLTTNGLALNANYYFTITDNAGTTFYVPCANALW